MIKNSYTLLCNEYDALKKQHHALIKKHGFGFRDIVILYNRFKCRLALFLFKVILFLKKEKFEYKRDEIVNDKYEEYIDTV